MIDRWMATWALTTSIAATLSTGCSGPAPPEPPGAFDVASPGPRRAVAQYEVSATSLPLLENKPIDPVEFDVFRATQVAYIKSPFVLASALRDPKVAAIGLLDEAEDPIEWLQEHLLVGYPSDGEILEIAVAHPTGDEAELVQLANAVSAAYDEEVVFRQQTERRLPLQLLKKAAADLAEQLNRKRETRAALARDAGQGGDVGVRVELALDEIRSLRAEYRAARQLLLKRAIAAREDADATDDPPEAPGDETLSLWLAELTTEIERLTQSALLIAGENVDLTARDREIERLEVAFASVESRIQELEIELEAPNRVRAIGLSIDGHAKAEFHSGSD